MQNFVFDCKTKIVFGNDAETKVGQELKGIAKKVLIHYGSQRIKKSDLFDVVTKSLTDNGIEYVELGGVKANPVISLVRTGIELIKAENVDTIVAIGGGSVVDSAKAMGVGVYYDGDVWDFFEGKAEITKMMPLAVVLTLPATGSEASNSSVVTNSEGQLKCSIGFDIIRPTLSFR